MDKRRLIAVTGATGRQGGAVARLLALRGWRVRALTRRTESIAAAALATAGIELVACDLGDPAATDAALRGVDGLFLMTTPYEGGVDEEERLAELTVDAARRADIDQIVYSSVAGADRSTGVAHFESKARIERQLSRAGFGTLTVLRPAFFMEMLLSPRFREPLARGRVEWMLSAETPFAMVSIEDIAAFAGLAFDQPAALNGRRVDLAGDQPTAGEIAATLSRVLDRPIVYRKIPAGDVSAEAMPRPVTQRWLEEMGWRIDTRLLAGTYPIALTRFDDWASRHRAALLEPI